MQLTIVTGASRGLGQALVEAMLAPGQLLICMARSSMAGLEMAAARRGCLLDARCVNLANPNAAAAALANSLGEVDIATVTTVTLINNAGTVEPVKPAEKLKADEVAASLALNLTTPHRPHRRLTAHHRRLERAAAHTQHQLRRRPQPLPWLERLLRRQGRP